MAAPLEVKALFDVDAACDNPNVNPPPNIALLPLEGPPDEAVLELGLGLPFLLTLLVAPDDAVQPLLALPSPSLEPVGKGANVIRAMICLCSQQ
jgi:hypothetical protein